MKYAEMIKALDESQECDADNREKSQEQDDFVNKPDGQWEPGILEKFEGKPRYTFDECTPIIDQIVNDLFQYDFSATVRPSSNGTKEVAKVYKGIMHNLDSISGVNHIYRAAARDMVTSGIAGWRVLTDWADADSFEQDLLIKPIHNFRDRVWFDASAERQDMSDADYGWVLTAMSTENYDKDFPKGSRISVGTDSSGYNDQKTVKEVIVGEFLYKVYKRTTLVLMSNGSVYTEKNLAPVVDELEATGITIKDTREAKVPTVYSRFFDGSSWLGDATETVFQHIPIIPLFGNFHVAKDSTQYRGEVGKLMDPQRVLNYSESRKVEETSLTPRRKIIMTKEQATSEDVRRTVQTMNTNTDPVQFYDYVQGQPSPFIIENAQPNSALVQVTESMERRLNRTSGKFEEARGESTNVISGVAIDSLQDKSQAGNGKYFEALEIALRHTQIIRIKAIPQIYSKGRQVRMLSADGATEVITLGQVVQDQQTGRPVTLNDITQGTYDVAISINPSFDNQQQETVNAITEIASIDPSIIQIGSDVLYNNVAAPGMELLAERKRLQMLAQGIIPVEQMTEEEKQLVQQLQQQQAQQGEQIAPMDQALLIQAQAQAKRVQVQEGEAVAKAQDRQQRTLLESDKIQGAQKLAELTLMLKEQKQQLDALTAVVQGRNTEADTLKVLKEAMGADVIVGPGNAQAYSNQTDLVVQSQHSERLPRR